MGGSCVALAPVDRHHVAEVARQRPPHLRRAAYTILQVEGSSSSVNSIQERICYMIEKVRSLEARPSGFFLCVKTYPTTEITDKYKR